MQQWIRDIRLVISTSRSSTSSQTTPGDESSVEALDFSQFRIKFEIRQAMVDTPASAEIYIYNVSKSTSDKFIGLGQQIILEAGYKDGRGIIFKGTVRQMFRSRESQTDTYLCVLGQSSDLSRNYSVTNGTINAGYDHNDMINRVTKDMQSKGDLESVDIQGLPNYKMPRGRALFGMSREYISEIANTHDLQVGYVDNKIQTYTQSSTVDAERAVVMNSTTGMVGMPQLTINGVYVTCLLRPDIKPNSQVHINESSVKRELYSVAYAAEGSNIKIDESMIATDGYYKVVSVDHYGDTRGNEWYSQLCCVGINATAPLGGPSITAV